MPKRNWLISAGFFALIAAHMPYPQADKARAQAIIEGILGKGTATLEGMDVNPDGRIRRRGCIAGGAVGRLT